MSRAEVFGDDLPVTMRIFLAGATGVLGSRLVRLLTADGHAVVGMTRSPEKATVLRRAGAEPVVCDVYDRDALIREVCRAAPEMVIHQLTDLPDSLDELAGARKRNARMRRVGTRNLVDAAGEAGATRLLAQSIAWEPTGDGAQAKAELERIVRGFGGVVLRYGQLYGPGTFHQQALPEHPRVQIDEAATRTMQCLMLTDTTVMIAEAR